MEFRKILCQNTVPYIIDVITYCQLIEVKITWKFDKPVVTLWHRVLLKNIDASLYDEREKYIASEE